MPTSTERIPTTHVGSLIRPPRLREFLSAVREHASYDEAAFETCLRESVLEVVPKVADVDAGVALITA